MVECHQGLGCYEPSSSVVTHTRIVTLHSISIKNCVQLSVVVYMYAVYTVKLLNKGMRWEQYMYKFTCFDFCREVDLFLEVLNFFCNYREINFLGPREVSFVYRDSEDLYIASSAWRVYYRRFHCIYIMYMYIHVHRGSGE